MFFVFEILNFENRFYFLPHITTHFQPNTSLLNSSLGGLKFAIDGEGNRCYLGADGSLIPFKRGKITLFETNNQEKTTNYSTGTLTYSFKEKGEFLVFAKCTTLGFSNVSTPALSVNTKAKEQILYSYNQHGSGQDSALLVGIYMVEADIDNTISLLLGHNGKLSLQIFKIV